MRIDVLALQRFYGSRLGEMARRMAARRIEALWTDAAAQDVLGLGYALPYLERYRESARRVVALMPAAQGVEPWPAEAKTLSVLGDEERLPFKDALFDRVLLVHALEEADAPRTLLREVWRVMAPEGRLLVVAASRSGVWAHIDHTPFGQGRPFSRAQLAALLSEAMFEPMVSACALYPPPVDWPAVVGLADGLERAGEMIVPGFGGLVLMEAVKRLYADVGGKPAKVLLARAPSRAKPAAQNVKSLIRRR